MKSILRNFLLTAAAMGLGASAALGAPWPPAKGDLLLGVQAISGSGATTNLFYNLGPAHTLRDNPNPGSVLANLNAELTAVFGADWATRTDLFFGVIAVRQKTPPLGSGLLGATGPENGDPARTVYASVGTGTPGASVPWTGFSLSALGTIANNHHGQVDADLPAINHSSVVPNGNGVAIVSQSTHPTPWNNSWTRWNPVPGAGFAAFTGGIQRQFAVEDPNGEPGDPGISQLKMLDLYRIPSDTGNGTYVSTVYLADDGNLTIGTEFVTLTGTVVGDGSIAGAGEFYPKDSVVPITAVPDPGFGFVGWSGDATGTANPLNVTMNASKTITATFAVLPAITAPTVTGITGTGATLGGNVTSDGGETVTERGVVFSEHDVNADPEIGGTGVTQVAADTASTGVFTKGVTGLDPGKTYAFKAYVTTAAATVYTAVATFTTDTEVDLSINGLASVAGRSILANGKQLFRFTLGQARLLLVNASNAAGLQGRLLDGSGNVIATGNGNFLLQRALAAGNYAIEINAGASPATFSLDFDATGVATTRPDVSVGPTPPATIGNNVYSPAVQRAIIVSKRAVPKTAFARVGNDGTLTEPLRVTATRGNAQFKVVYTATPGGNVTAAITGAGFTTGALDQGVAPVSIRASVAPNKKALVKKRKKGKKTVIRVLKKTFTSSVKAASTSNPAVSDTAQIQVKTK